MDGPGPPERARFPWDNITPGILLALLGTAVNGLAAWCGNDDGRCTVPTKDALTLGGGTLFALFGFCEAISTEGMRGWKARGRQLISMLDKSPLVIATISLAYSVYGMYDLARTALNPAGEHVPVVYLTISFLFYLGLGIWMLLITLRSERRTWSSLSLPGLRTLIDWGHPAEVIFELTSAIFLCILLALAVWLRVRLPLAAALLRFTDGHVGSQEDINEALLAGTLVALTLCLGDRLYVVRKRWIRWRRSQGQPQELELQEHSPEQQLQEGPHEQLHEQEQS